MEKEITRNLKGWHCLQMFTEVAQHISSNQLHQYGVQCSKLYITSLNSIQYVAPCISFVYNLQNMQEEVVSSIESILNIIRMSLSVQGNRCPQSILEAAMDLLKCISLVVPAFTLLQGPGFIKLKEIAHTSSYQLPVVIQEKLYQIIAQAIIPKSLSCQSEDWDTRCNMLHNFLNPLLELKFHCIQCLNNDLQYLQDAKFMLQLERTLDLFRSIVTSSRELKKYGKENYMQIVKPALAPILNLLHLTVSHMPSTSLTFRALVRLYASLFRSFRSEIGAEACQEAVNCFILTFQNPQFTRFLDSNGGAIIAGHFLHMLQVFMEGTTSAVKSSLPRQVVLLLNLRNWLMKMAAF